MLLPDARRFTPAARLFFLDARRSPFTFWMPASGRALLPDAPHAWTRLAPGCASHLDAPLCTHLRAVPVLPPARSLRFNGLDDAAKRAITAVQRPGLDVQL